MYVFDTGAYSFLFRNIFKEIFLTAWDRFDELIVDRMITPTLEVFREIDNSSLSEMRTWASGHKYVFPAPTPAEALEVSNMFSIPHFQSLIGSKNLQKGGTNADPFVIARAKVLGSTVVTTEKWKPNAAKIPNVCDHFNVDYYDVKGFMKQEGWRF